MSSRTNVVMAPVLSLAPGWTRQIKSRMFTGRTRPMVVFSRTDGNESRCQGRDQPMLVKRKLLVPSREPHRTIGSEPMRKGTRNLLNRLTVQIEG